MLDLSKLAGRCWRLGSSQDRQQRTTCADASAPETRKPMILETVKRAVFGPDADQNLLTPAINLLTPDTDRYRPAQENREIF
jgi:hypothetical protein